MSRVADKIVMIVRSATKVVAWTTMPRSVTKRAHDIVATLRDKASWAACGVKLLANGMTIRVVTFLAIHPVKPLSRPCGTYSEVPYGHQTA